MEDDVDQGSEVSSQETSGSTDSTPALADLEAADQEAQGPDEGQIQTENEPIEIEITEASDDNDIDNEVEFYVTTDNEYSNVEIGDVNEDSVRTMSQSSSADTLSDLRGSPRRKPVYEKVVSEDQLSGNMEETLEIDVSEAIQPGHICQLSREGDIGSITDNEVPLVYCVRLLSSKFLLTGYPNGLIPDRQVRVSVKALALGCIGSAMALYPTVFLYDVHKSSIQEGRYFVHVY